MKIDISQQCLDHMLVRQQIPHALLLTSVDKSHLEKIASDFAHKALDLSTKKVAHPDIHLFYPEGKTGMHSIQSIRTLIQKIAYEPYNAPYQFFLIHEAERMLPSSANALLKTFEEPSSKSKILLLSCYPDKLLTTIRSRCQMLTFQSHHPQKRSVFLESLLDVLEHRSLDASKVDSIVEQLDGEKKNWEKELLAALPADLPTKQKEVFVKEIEGNVALRYQHEVTQLLEGVIKWYRDLYAYHLGVQKHLFFPNRQNAMAQLRPVSLSKVTQLVAKTQLALERSMKLSSCLQTLFMQLTV